jgi:outer membrane protein OmpA-like peptidoglycan-associated protein/uncharacterized protein YegP (UPF0339 family)
MATTTTHDDYLVCSEYQEQISKKSAEHPGFITFQHANGNHYFAWVNDDKIILRSEAYPDADKMQKGIAAILKNCDLPERYRIDVQHGAHFLCLMGGGDHQKHTGNLENHSEIGRSCPQKSDADLHASLLFKGKEFADKVVPLGATATTAPEAEAAAAKHEDHSAAATTAAAASTVAASTTSSASTTTASSNTTTTNTATAHASAPKVETANTSAQSYAASSADTSASGGGSSWLKWLLPLLLLAGAAYWWKSCRTTTDETASTVAADAGTTTVATGDTNTATVATSTDATTAITTSTDATATTTTATTAATTVAAAVESIKVKLVDGKELSANKGGVEDKLVAFLNNKSATFNADDKAANWYDFDNLNFDLGKSTITSASMVQIQNLADILKAYPALKIKVGGYTDRKGNDASNKTLSQSRADAVVAALKAKGANVAQLVGAEGYGEELAKVDEGASDEARRADRRTAVRIMAK